MKQNRKTKIKNKKTKKKGEKKDSEELNSRKAGKQVMSNYGKA